MNCIVMQRQIDLYIERSRNARFYRDNYNDAINNAIRLFVEERAGDKKQTSRLSELDVQQVTDEIYTLVTQQSAAPTNSIALYPNNYYMLLSLFATIGGTSYYCRPTTDNQLGPLLDDSYRAPSSTKPYYLQNATGFEIFSGGSTITSVELNYLKKPDTVNIGMESQLINAGTGVLSNATSYIATQVSVHNSVNYNIGDQFTSANTNLTSGQVILTSNVTNCNLPDKTHEEINKMASLILLGATADQVRAQFAAQQASKS